MNHIDTLRYQLADALYVAEGRYGTLEGEIRLGLDDDDVSGWAAVLRGVRCEVETLLVDEFDGRRMVGCVESLRLIDDLLAALDAATSDRATLPCPAPVPCQEAA